MTRQVIKHYRKISDQYYSRNNKYCEKKYIEIINKYSQGKTSVLELGCGDGHMAQHINGNYTGVDISIDMINQNKYLKNGDMLKVDDAEQLSFEDDSFDMVFSINLLEHVNNPKKVLSEISRVLLPDGIVVIITPNGDIGWFLEILEKLQLKLPEGEHRFLKKKELIEVVSSSYFKKIILRKMIIFPFGRLGTWSDWINDKFHLNTGLFHLLVCKKTL